MDINISEALKVLFDPDETAAFGNSKYDVSNIYSPFLSIGREPIFYSLNPIETGTRKCDANVSAYRNFLMEMDSVPLEEQMDKMDLLKVPYSVAIGSGNKSIHFVLCLQENLSHEKWEHLNNWIHKALPFIDHNTKAESVWTRYPESIRPETGKIQELAAVGFRWSLYHVESFLKSQCSEPEWSTAPKGPLIIPKAKGRLRLDTYARIDGNYENVEGRNCALFAAACDMLQKGYAADEAYTKLRDNFPFDHTFDEQEFSRSIKSAVKTIQGNTP